MKRVFWIVLLSSLLPSLITGFLQAQEDSMGGRKRITIMIRERDANGNEKTERIVKEGKEAEDFDVNQFLKERDNGETEIRIEETDDAIQQKGEIRKDFNLLFKDLNSEFRDLMNSDEWRKFAEKWKGLGPGHEKFEFHDLDSAEEDKPFLGVVVEKNEKGQGVEILEVIQGSAADSAGLKVHDILESVDGMPVGSHEELVEIISKHQPGDIVQLQIRTGEQVSTKRVPLGKRREENITMRMYRFPEMNEPPTPPGREEEPFGIPGAPGEPRLNIPPVPPAPDMPSFRWMPEEQPQGAQLGVNVEDESGKGARVNQVNPNTAASKAGIKPGDLIYAIDERKVRSADELVRIIRSYLPGETIQVSLKRDGKRKKVEVVLGAREARNLFGYVPGEDRKERQVIIQKMAQSSFPAGEDVDFQNFELFPNPANSSIKVKFQTNSHMPVQVNVRSMDGKEVYAEMIRDFSGNYDKLIDLSGNAKGVYILTIQQGSEIRSEKILFNE